MLQFRGLTFENFHNITFVKTKNGENQYFIKLYIMTAILERRESTSLWARFCEWIPKTVFTSVGLV
jgi:hypothetical protein